MASVQPEAASAHPPAVPAGEPDREPETGLPASPSPDPDQRAEKLIHQRAKKLRATAASASSTAAAWAVKSGKQTAGWTASAGKSAARNVRTWPIDHVRRALVTVVVLGTLAAIVWLTGLFGGPEIWNAEVLAPDASVVAPNRLSLLLWAVIGLGLLAYVVHQWLPHQGDSPRHRRVGWAVITAAVLTLALALATRAGLDVLHLALLCILLVVLLVTIFWLNRWPAATRLDAAMVDVPLGLFLGWTGYTAFSSAAAVLTRNGFTWVLDDAVIWALIGLGILVLAGSIVCSTDRGRVSVALALSWGLGWTIVERITGQPASVLVAAAAALAAFLILITAGSRRHHVDHSYRRALRRRQTANLPPIELTDDDDDYYDEDEDGRNLR
ncbi:hypothetical protein GC088_01805 [Arthrobacter sp. JZ12]|uniref:hypothetical protein n=1 Tax=Arthrobacter sp. JZ12 TaxID=2654190 RepID=UPI002B4A344B|nr:hypothetical protein [Arthrobacter sp. JZ12]WRH23972.1 hypothetical protein GC088_01805 [Arthrobacter sp. JZ12]